MIHFGSSCYLCLKGNQAWCNYCMPISSATLITRHGVGSILVSTTDQYLAKRVILAMKQNRQKDLVKPIASFIAKSLPTIPSSFILTWIPSTRKNLAARHRDYLELISKELGKILHIPVKKVLVNHSQRVDQKLLSSSQRHKNMENAFTVKSNCSNASVIVLDDIVTTGATLAAAKAALVNAGFKQIAFVTFTSIPKSDSSSY